MNFTKLTKNDCYNVNLHSEVW